MWRERLSAERPARYATRAAPNVLKGHDDGEQRGTGEGQSRAATPAQQARGLDHGRRRRDRERNALSSTLSPGGAKIVSEVVFDVKDRLALTLLADHSKRYACEVVWRRGKTYGLKFVVAEPADEALAEPAGAAGTKS
ncbi:PilZ domain-containing protein [Bradyrhizobium sp. ISRA435]|nr:PilZ domain-containing protein [Bradyrhizobium sp. ISRA435]